MHLAKENC